MPVITINKCPRHIDEIELYVFEGASGVFRITPHEFDVEIDGHAYARCAMQRSALALGAEAAKSALEITLPQDHALVQHLLQAAIIGEQTAVRVLRVRRNNTGNTWSFPGTRWMGRVLGVEAADDVARIRCESVEVSLKRIGLKRLYSRSCSHALYSQACGATPITVTTEVIDCAGSVVVVPALPTSVAEMLPGGWLQTPSGARHMIVDQALYALHEVRLLYPVSIPAGTEVTLTAGCDHSMATCATRFGNLDNFGGFPFIPSKNPFSTGVF
jgi:hypothetical protein